MNRVEKNPTVKTRAGFFSFPLFFLEKDLLFLFYKLSLYN